MADDVVEMQASKKNLSVRVRGLVKIFKFSWKAAFAQERVHEKNRMLRLYLQAIESTITGMTITDVNREYIPIINCKPVVYGSHRVFKR